MMVFIFGKLNFCYNISKRYLEMSDAGDLF